VITAVGDVSGKGVPAALYAVFAGELVRGRTFRRRHLPERSSPAYVLMSINTILHERQLEEYYCTLCYAVFDLKRHTMTMANSGVPYPIRMSGGETAPVVLPGVPLGSFFGVTYDEVSLPLSPGDVFVFCSDGVTEAMNAEGEEYTSERLIDVINRSRDLPARGIADAIFKSVEEHRAGAAPNDDTTVVVVRISQ
jgi:sigma-B regulation protein RsbU (phosphoserine phosphatase)